jgi:hypothetical protein
VRFFQKSGVQVLEVVCFKPIDMIIVPAGMYGPQAIQLYKQRKGVKPLQIRLPFLAVKKELSQRLRMLHSVLAIMLSKIAVDGLWVMEGKGIVLMITHQGNSGSCVYHSFYQL